MPIMTGNKRFFLSSWLAKASTKNADDLKVVSFVRTNALEIMGYGSAEKNRIRDFGNSRKTQRRRLHSGHAKIQDN